MDIIKLIRSGESRFPRTAKVQFLGRMIEEEVSSNA